MLIRIPEQIGQNSFFPLESYKQNSSFYVNQLSFLGFFYFFSCVQNLFKIGADKFFTVQLQRKANLLLTKA